LDISSHDVLLIGGGGAGLRAAIAVAETNPNLDIAVISKVYPMRSHTVSAEGGAAGVARSDDSLDEHAYDTISGGDWLPDQDAVEAFVKEAPLELMRLEHWGCPWNRELDCRRQDRLPLAPQPVPDVAEVQRSNPLRRVLRHQTPDGRWPSPGRGGDR